MSIKTQIERIKEAKNAIISSLIGKGISVPTSAKIDDMALLIDSIPENNSSNNFDEFVMDTAVVSITSELTAIKSKAFQKWATIQEANFPNASSIGSYAFDGCTGLKNVNLPECTSLGGAVAYTFRNCSLLESVNLPKATIVGSGVFHGCANITTIDLPSTAQIWSSAMTNCSKLTSLILRRTAGIATLLNKNALQGTAIENQNGYIYVPSALVDKYKANTNWAVYANQFIAIEKYSSDGTVNGELYVIHFNYTVDGTNYVLTAIEGMTWSTFCNSDFNNQEFYISNDNIVLDGGATVIDQSTGVAITGDSIINPNITYDIEGGPN